MLDELSLRAWKLSGKPWPTYLERPREAGLPVDPRR